MRSRSSYLRQVPPSRVLQLHCGRSSRQSFAINVLTHVTTGLSRCTPGLCFSSCLFLCHFCYRSLYQQSVSDDELQLKSKSGFNLISSALVEIFVGGGGSVVLESVSLSVDTCGEVAQTLIYVSRCIRRFSSFNFQKFKRVNIRGKRSR